MYVLTVFVLTVAFDDRFGSLTGDEKPFARVGQVLVLDSQVFSQDTLTLGKSVRVRTEQLIVLVLVLIITVACRENVVIELHHGYHASVQKIFRVHHFGARVLPQSCQHVGPIHGHVRFNSESFLQCN